MPYGCYHCYHLYIFPNVNIVIYAMTTVDFIIISAAIGFQMVCAFFEGKFNLKTSLGYNNITMFWFLYN